MLTSRYPYGDQENSVGWLITSELPDGRPDTVVRELSRLGPSRYFHEAHRDRDTQAWCDGITPMERIVLQEDPLTLSPSIKCPVCGRHGWVIEGRWREARPVEPNE